MRPLEIPTSTLCDGHVEEISEEVPPVDLAAGESDIHWGSLTSDEAVPGGPEVVFSEPVCVEGRLYAADDHLVLEVSVETDVALPCLVCNQWVQQPLRLERIQVVQEATRFPTGVWDIAEEVREALVLEVPQRAECGGKCPAREELKNYLGREGGERSPFADL